MSDATYNEYLNATRFARWKYKYGLFVLIGCWICLVLLIVYTIVYARELSTHPAMYMLEELGVDSCYCYGDGKNYVINSTSIYVTDYNMFGGLG